MGTPTWRRQAIRHVSAWPVDQLHFCMLAATHRCKKILKTRFFPKVDQARASWDEDVSHLDAVNPKQGACDLGAMGQRVVSHQQEGGLPCQRPRVAAAAASLMSGWGEATPIHATTRIH